MMEVRSQEGDLLGHLNPPAVPREHGRYFSMVAEDPLSALFDPIEQFAPFTSYVVDFCFEEWINNGFPYMAIKYLRGDLHKVRGFVPCI